MSGLNCVVGVGCSAGGVEALKQIVGEFTTEEAAIVIVQHLSPDHESMMVPILEKVSAKKVLEVKNDQILQPNHIYVTPPGYVPTIDEETIRLKKQDQETPRAPLSTIDQFFTSLAEAFEESAVAVILSGSGSDGLHGCRQVREASGSVIAQDPQTAQFPSMPNAVIGSGYADVVAELKDIPKVVDGIVERVINNHFMDLAEDQYDQILQEIIGITSKTSGIDFSKYKNSTLKRRITKRTAILNLESIGDYLIYLSKTPDEVKKISEEFLIGVTSFFRDRRIFDKFAKKAVAPLVAKKKEGSEIRVWVPACSTGEEAFSIAMYLDDEIRRSGKNILFRIFASDVDGDAIRKAQSGVYDRHETKEFPVNFQNRYFNKEESDKIRIKRSLRDNIVFSKHDLISDPPFGKMDIISFRNCSIYFDRSTQQEVLAILEQSLNLGGYLFLGSSESLPQESVLDTIDGTAKIFKKSTHKSPESRVEILNIQNERLRLRPKKIKNLTSKEQLLLEVSHDVFGRLIPPTVLLGPNLQALHVFGDISPFTSVSPGEKDGSFLDFLQPEIKPTVVAAIRRLELRGKESNLQVKSLVSDHKSSDDSVLTVSVTRYNPTQYENVFVVTFFLTQTSDEVADPTEHNPSEMVFLKEELAQSRKDLDNTVESLEVANEELQSTNEELVSSNEELQSTNEELQSVNEELHTMNAEYQAKIEELSLANRDMETLLSVSKVGTMFLDKNLAIRKMSTLAMDVFNFRKGDVGRPIVQFSSPLYPSFIEDCRKVLEDDKIIENQVNLGTFGWNLVKIHPYKNSENEPDGLVVLIVDVSELKAAQDSNDWLFRFLLSENEIIFGVNMDGVIDMWGKEAENFFGMSREEAIGKSENIFLPLSAHSDTRIINSQIEKGEPAYLHSTVRLDANDQEKQVNLLAMGRYNENGRLVGIKYTVFEYIEGDAGQGRAKRELEAVRVILESSPVAIVVLNKEGQFEYANPHAMDLLEFTNDQLMDKNASSKSWNLKTAEGKEIESEQTPFYRMMYSGEKICDEKLKVTIGSGVEKTVLISGAPIKNGRSDSDGAVFTLREIRH